MRKVFAVLLISILFLGVVAGFSGSGSVMTKDSNADNHTHDDNFNGSHTHEEHSKENRSNGFFNSLIAFFSHMWI